MMSMKYNVIEIFTSEKARWQAKPLHRAIVGKIRDAEIGARCLVTRGIGGCYENGELSSTSMEVLFLNMPLKIEIILPTVALDAILPVIEEMVTDGIVAVKDINVCSHRTK